LADLVARITADDSLSIKQRQETASALRTVAKALQRRPEEIPAHPLYLKERLEKLNAAAVGLSVGRWRNAVSFTRVALKHAGLSFVPGRYREPLAPDWEELYRHLNDDSKRYGLSRFARYCSVHGIAPSQVNDDLLQRFLDDLQRSLIDKAQRVHRTACKVWNQAAATIPCWPKVQLTVPDYRKQGDVVVMRSCRHGRPTQSGKTTSSAWSQRSLGRARGTSTATGGGGVSVSLQSFCRIQCAGRSTYPSPRNRGRIGSAGARIGPVHPRDRREYALGDGPEHRKTILP
jgi:hypothetical protein